MTTKQEQLVALLRRPEGASLDELADALGWQARSCRSAITTLRNRGTPVHTTKEQHRQTIYRILES